MDWEFLSYGIRNGAIGFGNVLFNGFEFNVKNRRGITRNHLMPGDWEHQKNPVSRWVDRRTGDIYDYEPNMAIRVKCLALLAATPVQAIGLLLNLINRTGKLFSLAHLWAPSTTAGLRVRLFEMAKDILRIVATPFLLLGFVFTSLCGATFAPLNGRKWYAVFEKLAYSGGYHHFVIRNPDDVQNALLGLCFQPECQKSEYQSTKYQHFFGGKTFFGITW